MEKMVWPNPKSKYTQSQRSSTIALAESQPQMFTDGTIRMKKKRVNWGDPVFKLVQSLDRLSYGSTYRYNGISVYTFKISQLLMGVQVINIPGQLDWYFQGNEHEEWLSVPELFWTERIRVKDLTRCVGSTVSPQKRKQWQQNFKCNFMSNTRIHQTHVVVLTPCWQANDGIIFDGTERAGI